MTHGFDPWSRQAHAHKLLYRIEVALREFIIETYSQISGPTWYKARLNASALDNYKQGKQEERRSKWTEFIDHDPVYYLDFPQLRETFAKGGNWTHEISAQFGSKDLFLAELSQLEPIRNKIAHNRRVTPLDVVRLSAFESRLARSLGSDQLELLVNRCSLLPDAIEVLRNLISEIEQSAEACQSSCKLPERAVWNSINTISLISILEQGTQLASVKECFDLFDKYDTAYERSYSYQLERFCRKERLSERCDQAFVEIQGLISGGIK